MEEQCRPPPLPDAPRPSVALLPTAEVQKIEQPCMQDVAVVVVYEDDSQGDDDLVELKEGEGGGGGGGGGGEEEESAAQNRTAISASVSAPPVMPTSAPPPFPITPGATTLLRIHLPVGVGNKYLTIKGHHDHTLRHIKQAAFARSKLKNLHLAGAGEVAKPDDFVLTSCFLQGQFRDPSASEELLLSEVVVPPAFNLPLRGVGHPIELRLLRKTSLRRWVRQQSPQHRTSGRRLRTLYERSPVPMPGRGAEVAVADSEHRELLPDEPKGSKPISFDTTGLDAPAVSTAHSSVRSSVSSCGGAAGEADNPILLAGYMHFKDMNSGFLPGTKWKRRWFFLTETHLHWMKTLVPMDDPAAALAISLQHRATAGGTDLVPLNFVDSIGLPAKAAKVPHKYPGRVDVQFHVDDGKAQRTNTLSLRCESNAAATKWMVAVSNASLHCKESDRLRAVSTFHYIHQEVSRSCGGSSGGSSERMRNTSLSAIHEDNSSNRGSFSTTTSMMKRRNDSSVGNSGGLPLQRLHTVHAGSSGDIQQHDRTLPIYLSSSQAKSARNATTTTHLNLDKLMMLISSKRQSLIGQSKFKRGSLMTSSSSSPPMVSTSPRHAHRHTVDVQSLSPTSYSVFSPLLENYASLFRSVLTASSSEAFKKRAMQDLMSPQRVLSSILAAIVDPHCFEDAQASCSCFRCCHHPRASALTRGDSLASLGGEAASPHNGTDDEEQEEEAQEEGREGQEKDPDISVAKAGHENEQEQEQEREEQYDMELRNFQAVLAQWAIENYEECISAVLSIFGSRTENASTQAMGIRLLYVLLQRLQHHTSHSGGGSSGGDVHSGSGDSSSSGDDDTHIHGMGGGSNNNNSGGGDSGGAGNDCDGVKASRQCRACQTTSKQLVQYIQDNCAGKQYALDALLSVLITDVSTAAFFAPATATPQMSSVVYNATAWHAFLAALGGASWELRKEFLLHLNVLLVQRRANRRTLLRQHGWQKHVARLTHDVPSPPLTVAVLKHIYQYAMNAFALLHQQSFESSVVCYAKDLTLSLQAFQATFHNRVRALERSHALLAVSMCKFRSRLKTCFPIDDLAAPAWANIDHFIRILRVYLFASPTLGSSCVDGAVAGSNAADSVRHLQDEVKLTHQEIEVAVETSPSTTLRKRGLSSTVRFGDALLYGLHWKNNEFFDAPLVKSIAEILAQLVGRVKQQQTHQPRATRLTLRLSDHISFFNNVLSLVQMMASRRDNIPEHTQASYVRQFATSADHQQTLSGIFMQLNAVKTVKRVLRPIKHDAMLDWSSFDPESVTRDIRASLAVRPGVNKEHHPPIPLQKEDSGRRLAHIE